MGRYEYWFLRRRRHCECRGVVCRVVACRGYVGSEKVFGFFTKPIFQVQRENDSLSAGMLLDSRIGDLRMDGAQEVYFNVERE